MAEHDTALVRELAALARLELAAGEAEALAGQLDTILAYVRGLQAVDLGDAPEYLSAEQVRSGLRDDVVEGEPFDADRALAGVPALRERLVAVPRFKD